ncbi:protein of unknown function DUF4005 [Cynara cardunculus var. scolymus]|uniref:DUF4005 domain-containing protein n=1 Tax=Cynara cardunculus var. scolymus TaxID=59895 RepID=A0A103XJF5_CYNCS|nr:protein of unknown function DUF4005 [Cynara cardunculus var. scolymus]
MGKTSKFFKSLLGFKSTGAQPSGSDGNKQPKRRWSFVKSRRENQNPTQRNNSKSVVGTSFHHNHHNNSDERTEGGERNDSNEDSNKRAIALAAATAAVVDAALVAAQAAAEVVRMTSRTTGYGVHHELAAVKIQSCFRAYLAVVRGHILRKHTADMMRRLQALIRAQARARARALSTKSSSHFHHHGPQTPEKLEHFPHAKQDHRPIHKRNGSKSYANYGLTDHENDKIVEVDTGESHVTTKGRKLFQLDPNQNSFGYSQSFTTSRGSTVQPTSSSPCASCEVNSIDYSIKGELSTPVKSECSRSCLSGYSDHPNYMANTESSRAKVRSLSAPRLRTQFEISNATKRDSSSKYGSGGMQWVPTIRDSFVRKAYPGSGRLDRLGMPVLAMEENEFCVGYWN